MDTWLPFGRMPQKGNHLAGPGRLAGRQSSLHDAYDISNLIQFFNPKKHYEISSDLISHCIFNSRKITFISKLEPYFTDSSRVNIKINSAHFLEPFLR